MWNLLSIVREMYKRNDHNSIPLLEIVTLQCLETAQIMVWWFNTKVALQQAGQVRNTIIQLSSKPQPNDICLGEAQRELQLPGLPERMCQHV